MEDPNLILTVQPSSELAKRSLKLLHNQNRYFVSHSPATAPVSTASTRANTPAETEAIDQEAEEAKHFRLTFDQPPKDILRGFVFGTDKDVCDVLLAERRGQYRISGAHFEITFDQSGRLLLKDVSRSGTAVGFDGQNEDHRRTNFTWILFPQFRNIIATLKPDWSPGKEAKVTFQLDVPETKTCRAQYHEHLHAYLEARQKALPCFDVLGIHSQASTAAPSEPQTPRQRPIYHYACQLGSGSFGTVHKVLNVSTGDVHAAKTFHRGSRYVREVQVVKRVSHENIVQFVDFTNEPEPALIMEYVPHGNLTQSHQECPISRQESAHLLVQALEALKYLHDQKITHRDIKPDNILVHSRHPEFHIKITDFGLAKDDSFLRTACGTERYAAPEIWYGRPYTSAVDIWALGVVTLEFYVGFPSRAECHGLLWCETINDASKSHVKNDPEDHMFVLLEKMLEMDDRRRSSTIACLDEALDVQYGYLAASLSGSEDFPILPVVVQLSGNRFRVPTTDATHEARRQDPLKSAVTSSHTREDDRSPTTIFKGLKRPLSLADSPASSQHLARKRKGSRSGQRLSSTPVQHPSHWPSERPLLHLPPIVKVVSDMLFELRFAGKLIEVVHSLSSSELGREYKTMEAIGQELTRLGLCGIDHIVRDDERVLAKATVKGQELTLVTMTLSELAARPSEVANCFLGQLQTLHLIPALTSSKAGKSALEVKIERLDVFTSRAAYNRMPITSFPVGLVIRKATKISELDAERRARFNNKDVSPASDLDAPHRADSLPEWNAFCKVPIQM
ncbi:MAG: hypothetical protein M1816_002655 [Peltula sp. TS41687]|nr:MAG: hypothetical protein M1816_002655 [Peltula sp. TS41687]